MGGIQYKTNKTKFVLDKFGKFILLKNGERKCLDEEHLRNDAVLYDATTNTWKTVIS